MKAPENLLLTTEEMGRADRAAVERGVPGVELMAAAGLAVARCVERRWAPCRTLVLCGPGNNGGDGFVAARLLAAAGWPVRLLLLGDRDALRGDAAHHAALWEGAVEPLSEAAGRAAVEDWADLAIDALFGAGLSRALEGPAAAVVEALNRKALPSVAVDVPSGLSGDGGRPPSFARNRGISCCRAGSSAATWSLPRSACPPPSWRRSRRPPGKTRRRCGATVCAGATPHRTSTTSGTC